MRTIKLMTDYECFPLWEISDDVSENLDPCKLPISEELKCALQNWANQYDETLNHQDPLASCFASESAEKLFQEEGEKLFQWLEKELGSTFKILKH
jgi:hypothetical protein